MKLAFIGLGVMGYPMAGFLQKAGHDVCVYNRTSSKAIKWVEEYQGRYAATPALASDSADITFLCVGNDDDVRQVIVGTPEQEGILSVLHAGDIIIDHTTTSDVLAKEMSAAITGAGGHFLDAPVSGGQSGAECGQLAIMVGGEQEVFDRIYPVLQCYAKSALLMGAVGAGQSTKMVNQLLIAGVLQGISEGFALARKNDLDISAVIEAINAGAAGSWQLSNRGSNIDQGIFDYGFAIDWMRKDLAFCLASAAKQGLSLPNAERVDKTYAELQERGFNRADTSVLVKQFENF